MRVTDILNISMFSLIPCVKVIIGASDKNLRRQMIIECMTVIAYQRDCPMDEMPLLQLKNLQIKIIEGFAKRGWI